MITKFYNQTHTEKVVINYDNASLYYSGRWNFDTVGMCSGWGGSCLRFKVKGTSQIKLNFYLDITTTTDLSYVSFHTDNYPQNAAAYTIHTAGTTFTGDKSTTIPITNNGQWHNVYLYFGSVTNYMFNKQARTILKTLELEFGAEISLPTLQPKLIQFVGDSWNGTQHDYPYLLADNYNYYQVAGGGLKCSDAATMYNYDYTGILNTTDLTPDAIVVSFGVNDRNAGVTVGAFQTSLLTLIDEIQAKQVGVPIFLVRVPNNGALLYGQYLTAMNNAAGLRTNIIVGDTIALDSQVDWMPDDAHLGGNGKDLLKDFLKTTLIAKEKELNNILETHKMNEEIKMEVLGLYSKQYDDEECGIHFKRIIRHLKSRYQS